MTKTLKDHMVWIFEFRSLGFDIWDFNQSMNIQHRDSSLRITKTSSFPEIRDLR